MFVKCPSRMLLRQSRGFLAHSFRIPQTKPRTWPLFARAPQGRAYSDAKDATETVLGKFKKDAKEDLTLWKTTKWFGAGVGVATALLLLDIGFAYEYNRRNENTLLRAFEKGSCPMPDVQAQKLIEREAIINKLQPILKPESDHSSYHLVVGEHGTGKTTVVRQTARSVGEGVIYVDVPPVLNEFVDNLANAINFSFVEYVSNMETLKRKLLGYGESAESTMPRYIRVKRAFERGARKYKAKHGRPPVLILDNISKLGKKNVDTMEDLQDIAKLYADQSSCIVVFVSSEGSVPRVMAQRSSWSRADKKPIVIGDLSDEQALDYLQNKLSATTKVAKQNVAVEKDVPIKEVAISKEVAIQLIELLGGRVRDLKEFGGRILMGETFEEVRDVVFNAIKKNFREAKMMKNQSNHANGKCIIQELLKNGKIPLDTFIEIVDEKVADELLRFNVFSYNPANDTVSFQSRATEVFVKESLEIFAYKSENEANNAEKEEENKEESAKQASK